MPGALPTSGVCLGLQLERRGRQGAARGRATRSIPECTCIPAPLPSPQVLEAPLFPSQSGAILKAAPQPGNLRRTRKGLHRLGLIENN